MPDQPIFSAAFDKHLPEDPAMAAAAREAMAALSQLDIALSKCAGVRISTRWAAHNEGDGKVYFALLGAIAPGTETPTFTDVGIAAAAKAAFELFMRGKT